MRFSGGIFSLLPVFLGLVTLVAAAPATDLNKRCTKPSVRREWRALSIKQKTEWINAVKCLTKVPHKDSVVPYPDPGNYTYEFTLDKSSSLFDDFSFIHTDLNPFIHFTGHFLPWHRSFINRFERALREECGYKGAQPYWDWTKDSDDFSNSPIFNSDPVSGLGKWGNPDDDFQITDGAFADDFVRPYPVPHTLRRNFSVTPPAGGFNDGTPPDPTPLNERMTPEVVERLVEGHRGNFTSFQAAFESGPHGAVHLMVGGDLLGACPTAAGPNCRRGPKWTPNDPLFYLHHSMVDKVWYDWQVIHPENFWAYHGGLTGAHSAPGIYPIFPNGAPPFLNFGSENPDGGLLDKATIFELMDTRAYDLCYIYE